MKKFTKILSLMLLIIPCLILVSACGDKTPTKKDITGVTFVSESYDYDGTEKTIIVAGILPDGVSVQYTNNTGTNAGVYNASAVLSGDGYNSKTLNATLTINKLNYNMSAASWNYINPYTYDGNVKTIEITNLPTGVTINQYTNNSKTNAGNYTASATFNYDTTNHNTPTIANCNWVIDKANITGITFSNSSVEYDTLEHSIQIVGDVPADSTVSYTYNGESIESVTEVGEYAVVATITNINYNTLVKNATLTITYKEELLYSINHDGTLYFQNNLDDNKLYKVGTENIEKVNNDIPKYLVSDGTNLYYYSSSMFSSVIKSITGTTTSTLYSVNGEYLATDGTYIYYAINNLLINTDRNGIYKYKLDGSEENPIRLTTDKAEYLIYNDNFIYYSNLSNSKHLYKIATSSVNGTATLIHDEKVSYIISDGSNLYFNSSTTLASAIYKYHFSAGTIVKLTIDNGKYLTKIGSYIYYINSDWLTSNLFGKGIYKVSVLATEHNNSVGTKILEVNDNNGYSSLSGDGTYLYYYKLNDKHFYKYDVSNDTETDLMAGFVVSDTTTLSGYAKLAEYNGEIYYTNPLDSGCLYKYNITTHAKIKVLTDSVSNVYFDNEYMYYSTYVLTNYALFRMNLTTKESTKISSSRCDNLIFDGDYIYYTKIGVAQTYTNNLMKMKKDGTEVTILYSEKNLYITSLEKVGNNIYFCINPSIGYKYIYKYSITEQTTTNLDIKSDKFVINDNKIYYFDHTADSLKVYDITTSQSSVITSSVDISELYVNNGIVYYSTSEGKLFKYIISSNTTTKLLDNSASGILIFNNKLFFIKTKISYLNDLPINGSGNDGHLYCLDLASLISIKVA